MSQPIQAYSTELYLDDLLDSEYFDNNIQVFLDILSIALYCSPLHSRDLDGRGNPKKSHYHLVYSKSTDKQTIQALYSNLHTVMYPFGITGVYIEPIYKLDIYYQYLTHSDGKSRLNPYKADYSNEHLLWIHPQADIPHPPVDYQQQLRSLYNSECVGYSYSDFLSYIDIHYPDMTQCKDLYLPTFTAYVNDHFKQYEELHKLKTMSSRSSKLLAQQSKERNDYFECLLTKKNGCE